jgi:hypothetical protein
VLAIGVLAGPALALNEETPAFDKGEKDDLKNGYNYKVRDEKKDKDSKKKKDSQKLRAANYHLKNLKDPDPEVRSSSAEMLGILGAVTAVPELIDMLRPGREDKIMVLLSVHGALVRITGKNFGHKNYDQWQSWWLKEKEEFTKKAETGPDEQAKIAAVYHNTTGLEYLRAGQLVAAEQQFLMAVDRDPTIPDYKNNLGLAVMKQGRFLDAMEYFKETIGQNQDLPQPYMNTGRCYAGMNKSIEAEAWFKKAMDHDKEGRLWENYWMIGRQHLQRGEWKDAYEYLDSARIKAEKLGVHDPSLHKDIAITHFGMDQYHSAWKEIKNVETLGYQCDPGFVAKVKKMLKDAGVDAEAEDKLARDVQRGTTDDDKLAKKER